ncbi:Crp/Fnr family transcriptional regulator [Paraburkholderia fungorum]
MAVDVRAARILAVLPDLEWERLAPHLLPVDMPLGNVVYESGDRLNYVYFPTTRIVALLYVMEDGASAEIAIVGNEGLIGIALFMGGETTPSRAVVQSAGKAYRLDARILKEEFHRAGPVQRLLLRYTQALITQMAQTAVCNRHHSIDQQLCRWLLLSIDRLSSNELKMTQELIANMLGVRRSGVTEAAVKLCPLGEYLRAATSNELTLTFSEIEQIITTKLPPSALKHDEWWQNSTPGIDSHVQALAWMTTGWRKSRVNRSDRYVVFSRVGSKPDAEALEGLVPRRKEVIYDILQKSQHLGRRLALEKRWHRGRRLPLQSSVLLQLVVWLPC